MHRDIKYIEKYIEMIIALALTLTLTLGLAKVYIDFFHFMGINHHHLGHVRRSQLLTWHTHVLNIVKIVKSFCCSRNLRSCQAYHEGKSISQLSVWLWLVLLQL